MAPNRRAETMRDAAQKPISSGLALVALMVMTPWAVLIALAVLVWLAL
jgi:hypothetical protein